MKISLKLIRSHKTFLQAFCLYLLFNLGGAVDELVRPKLVLMILDKLDEGDEKTPRVRPVHNQPLQQNPNKKNR